MCKCNAHVKRCERTHTHTHTGRQCLPRSHKCSVYSDICDHWPGISRHPCMWQVDCTGLYVLPILADWGGYWVGTPGLHSFWQPYDDDGAMSGLFADLLSQEFKPTRLQYFCAGNNISITPTYLGRILGHNLLVLYYFTDNVRGVRQVIGFREGPWLPYIRPSEINVCRWRILPMSFSEATAQVLDQNILAFQFVRHRLNRWFQSWTLVSVFLRDDKTIERILIVLGRVDWPIG